MDSEGASEWIHLTAMQEAIEIIRVQLAESRYALYYEQLSILQMAVAVT